MRLKKIIGVLLLVSFSFVLVIGCRSGSKEAYPNQNINGIIPWGAGGETDTLDRTIVPLVEPILGTKIILSNKTGATGTIGTQYVYEQKADGYTLLFNAENPGIYEVLGLSNLDYGDFIPIMVMAKAIGVLVVNSDSPYQTYPDLINAMKNEKVKTGSSGVGALPFNSFSLVKKIENVEPNYVTYDGGGPLTTALLGNQVDSAVVGISTALQYIKNGDLRALAVFSNEPVELIKDVPTITSFNPAYEPYMANWGPHYTVAVHKDTPQEAVDKLVSAFREAAQSAKFQDFCNVNGYIPLGLTGQDAMDFLKKWQSETSWILHEVGATKESPEKFGIPKPNY
jgi:tripartite-type tricarboxylate transporter receptor subunit TctC